MSKAGLAKKIASKVSAKLESKAAMSGEEATKILQKFDTVDKATSISGAEKAKYLEALDSVYGDRYARQDEIKNALNLKDHGAMLEKERVVGTEPGHGAAVDSIMSNRALFKEQELPISKIKRDGMRRGEPVTETYDKPLFLENADDEEFAKKYSEMSKDTYQPITVQPDGDLYNVESGRHRTRAAFLRGDENVKADVLYRSRDANMDPRFKDSPNILAAAGGVSAPNISPFSAASDIASKISAKIKKAYEGSTLEKVDTAREQAIDKTAKQMDLYRAATGRNDTQFQDAANIALDFALPGTVDGATAGMGKLFKGVNAAGIVAKINGAQKVNKAAEAAKTAKAAAAIADTQNKLAPTAESLGVVFDKRPMMADKQRSYMETLGVFAPKPAKP